MCDTQPVTFTLSHADWCQLVDAGNRTGCYHPTYSDAATLLAPVPTAGTTYNILPGSLSAPAYSDLAVKARPAPCIGSGGHDCCVPSAQLAAAS